MNETRLLERAADAARSREPSGIGWLPSLPTVLSFALAALFVFGRLGSLPLLNPDEGRNAEVAREMAQSGRWLVPTYNGLPYLDKPAFYFKTVALSFQVLGKSETAARLPSALFAMALLVLVYRFCRREYGPRAGALAVMVVASMPLFLAFARIVIFDMPLAFFMSAAILAGFRAEETDGTFRRRWYLIGAASAALATLVKGPVGFLVPTLVLLALAVVERRKGVPRRLAHPLNLAVFFALVLPWFVGLTLEKPDFVYYGLVQESLERFVTPAFRRTGPFYYYVPVLAGVCFAWSVLFPASMALAWRLRSSWTRADRLLVVWAVVVVVFFSISQSKLPGYVLTAVVALGMLVARVFDAAAEHPNGRAGRLVFQGGTALSIVSGALAVWLSLELATPGTFTSLLRIASRDYERARALFPPVLLTVVVIGAAALLSTLSRRVWLVFAAFLLFPVSLLTVCFGGLEAYAQERSSRGLAREARSVAPGATVVCVECYPPGLAFYLERNLCLVTEDGRETTSNYIPYSLSRDADWPPAVIRPSQLERWLDDRQGTVLLLAREERSGDLERLAMLRGGSVRDLLDGWRGLVLSSSDSP